MDNQKSNEGNGRNVGNEGSGSSMGKDLSKDKESSNKGASGAGSSGSIGSSSGSTGSTGSASGSTGSTGSTGSSGSSASSMSSGTSASKSADLHQTIDKAAQAAAPMAERLASTAHDSVDKVSGALSDANLRMEEKTKQLAEAYGHFVDTGREYVRSSPATSVLVALAAGYTLSKLFGSRR